MGCSESGAGCRRWVCAAAMLMAPAVWADDDGALSDLLKLSIEELLYVEVSVASRFTESDVRAGSSVSLIREQDWERRGARRFADALASVPGVISLPNWFGADNVTVRGYADTNNLSGVAMMLDGVPLSTLASGTWAFDRQNIQLSTLDRIEMIRGPGSSIYGEDAFHGVLSLATFESAQDTARATAAVATNGYRQASVRFSAPLADGLRLNIAAGGNGQPEQNRTYSYTDPSLALESERDYSFASGTVVAKLVSDSAKPLSYRIGFFMDSNFSEDFLSAGSDTLKDLDVGGSQSRFAMTNAAVMRRFSAVRDVSANLFYWIKNHDYVRVTKRDRSKGTSETLSPTGAEHQWGANLVWRERESFARTRWSAMASTRNAAVDSAHQVTTNELGAVVAESDVPANGYERRAYSLSMDASTPVLGDTVQLNYGGRYDRYDDFGGHSSPRLGIVYLPDQDFAIKLLYGDAFRAPSAAEFKGTATIAGDLNITPETIHTSELVFLKRNPKWRAELTFFTSEWHDAIDAVPNPGGQKSLIFSNVRLSRAEGVEAIYERRMDAWRMELNGSYVRSRDQNADRSYIAFPSWIFNAGFGYRFAAYTTELFLNNRVHLNAAEGPYASNATSPADLRDYWRTDLSVETKIRASFDAFISIRNLFSRDNYLPSVQNAQGGIPDEPISLLAGVRYQL